MQHTCKHRLFGTNGSLLGNTFDLKITKKRSASNELYKKYLGKMFSAEMRKESGKSTSALIRQANKALQQSD